MGIIDAVKTVYRKYVTFSGRAARSEYWWWVLFNLVISVIIAVVEGGTTASVGDGSASAAYNAGPVGTIWALLNLLPGLAVGVRRLHDRDKSGVWLLLGLVPLVGTIILLVWFCQRGTQGPNRFGSDPLGADASVFA